MDDIGTDDVQLGVICIQCACGRRSWRRDVEVGFRPLAELRARLRCDACGQKGVSMLSRPIETLVMAAAPHDRKHNYTIEEWDEDGDRPMSLLATGHDGQAAQLAYLGARLSQPLKPMMLRQWARVVTWSRREPLEETARRAARLIAMSYLSIAPVSVWETLSVRRTITDVERGANFLLLKWPKAYMDNDLHRTAQLAALDALGGHARAADFRTAFVAAAREAEVLADD